MLKFTLKKRTLTACIRGRENWLFGKLWFAGGFERLANVPIVGRLKSVLKMRGGKK